MVSSQDAAIAAALTELGYEVEARRRGPHVEDGAPADGELEVRDIFVSVDGGDHRPAPRTWSTRSTPPAGEPVAFVVRRDGKRRTVEVTPEDVDGDKPHRHQLGTGFEFPFDVSVNIDRRHRRAQRRADVLAGRSTTPSPRAR